MPDPATVIPGSTEPEGTPANNAPRRAPRGIQCDFCDCIVADDGKVLRRGESAARFLELEDALKAEKELRRKDSEKYAAMESDLAAARARVSELEKKNKSWL